MRRGAHGRTEGARVAFGLPVLFSLALAAACRGGLPDESALSSQCPSVLADPAMPASADAARERRAGGARWTNAQVRMLYVCRARAIEAYDAKWKSEGLGAEQRARLAWKTRHEARLTARAMMDSADAVAMLERRDLDKYGMPDGPTFEWLVERARGKGLTGDALYEEIIAGALRTDDATNRYFGVE